MSLRHLLLLIASHPTPQRTLDFLIKTNIYRYTILNPVLYRRNGREDDSRAPKWAFQNGHAATAVKCPSSRRSRQKRALGRHTGHLGRDAAAFSPQRGTWDIERMLLCDPRVNPDCKARECSTPLGAVVACGQLEFVQLLVEMERVDVRGIATRSLLMFYGRTGLMFPGLRTYEEQV
ncbi:hypothetical protein BJX64DRAFT_284044 [Aspergillus heterothallicus]